MPTTIGSSTNLGYGFGFVEPTTPGLTFTIAASGAIDLTWTAYPGAISYTVYGGASPGALSPIGETLIPSFSIPGAFPAAQYYIQVSAILASRRSVGSNILIATPQSAPTAPITWDPAAGSGWVLSDSNYTATYGTQAFHYNLSGCPTLFDNIAVPWVSGGSFTASFVAGTLTPTQAVRTIITPSDITPSSSFTVIVSVDGGLSPQVMPVYYENTTTFIVNVASPGTKTILFTANSSGVVSWGVS